MDSVGIEYWVLADGEARWRVTLGRRGITFSEEMAARAFAAQLHSRLIWLRERSDLDTEGEPNPPG